MAIKRCEVLIHTTTWMNLDKITVTENPLVTKDHMLDDRIYMKCPEKAIYRDRKGSGYLGLEGKMGSDS